jgi:hypothetical protein
MRLIQLKTESLDSGHDRNVIKRLERNGFVLFAAAYVHHDRLVQLISDAATKQVRRGSGLNKAGSWTL